MLIGGPVNRNELQRITKFFFVFFVLFVAYLNQLMIVKRSPLVTGNTS